MMSNGRKKLAVTGRGDLPVLGPLCALHLGADRSPHPGRLPRYRKRMDYPTPLPDFSRLALAGSFQLAGRTCTLQVSTVQRFVDYGPDFDVLHLQVLLDGQPLALADLNARLPAVRCYQLWTDLCAALHETTIAGYALEPDPAASQTRVWAAGAPDRTWRSASNPTATRPW